MLAALVLLSITPIASAHTGHGVHGFGAGAIHPLTGLDHLLAMFAVGLWSSRVAGPRKWMLPSIFVSGMIIGMTLGVLTVPIPSVEFGIAGSVIAFGLLIAIGRNVPFPAAIALTLMFALFHGHAHGAEMPENTSALSFGAGMILATAFLHVSGIVVGTLMLRGTTGANLLRVGGGAVACCGVLLMVGVL